MSVRDAVIVSTARTPLCKSWRGSLNLTHGAKMGGHVVHAALERAKVDADEVDTISASFIEFPSFLGELHEERRRLPLRALIAFLKGLNTS